MTARETERLAATWLVRAAFLAAGIAAAVKGCRSVDRYFDNADRRQVESNDARRRSRMMECVARGGSWNEGIVGGSLSEWCAGLRR